jgi:hypothetical protein
MAKPYQRKKSGKVLTPSAILKLAGFVFIIIATVIVFYYRCLTAPEYLIVYTLIGLGIAFLLNASARKSSASYNFGEISIVLSGSVVLVFILYKLNPIDTFKQSNCNRPVSVTVFVHGKKGRQDMVLRQQGYVLMDVNGERKKEPINEKGQANFNNLSPGDKVLLDIDFSEPYKAVYTDSQYLIDEGGKIYLSVALQGIGQVQGMVLYNDQPLPGVIVKIQALTDTSDASGSFGIPVPVSLQASEYTVWFMKSGFKAKSVVAYPQTGQPLNIIMERFP